MKVSSNQTNYTDIQIPLNCLVRSIFECKIANKLGIEKMFRRKPTGIPYGVSED